MFLICKGVVSFVRLPCLTNESIDFEDSRKALTNLVSYLGTTFKNIKQKIKTLNKDLQMLQDDFKKVTWTKYNGHCYHFGTKTVPWFAADKKCRELGGYLVKVDADAENNWIASHKPTKAHYWIGLTDLQEGKWRWSYDQSDVTFSKWYPGYGNRGTSSNCVLHHAGETRWWDYHCHKSYNFICESNFCSK